MFNAAVDGVVFASLELLVVAVKDDRRFYIIVHEVIQREPMDRDHC